ncbi:hypothetical protein [Cupriavidus gilardii]|uniref:hypothetical protein n=1 Tax=Cupriavidus gilardii TaxID=82541 RepID=UPI0021B2D169|nr:hypothetical protein [Cupriavidus gilardii]UXC37100.1 hypothetical protein N4G38_06525 [Cupriavidus gilardii]
MTKPAFTVPEFCEAHGRMSRSLFYTLVKEGKGPRLMKIGRRTLISQEAAADWRRAMEAATVGIPEDVAA